MSKPVGHDNDFTKIAGLRGRDQNLERRPAPTGSTPANGFFAFVNTSDQTVNDNTTFNPDFPTTRFNQGKADCVVTGTGLPARYNAPGIKASVSIGLGVNGTTFGLWVATIEIWMSWTGARTIQGYLELTPGSPLKGNVGQTNFYRTGVTELQVKATSWAYFTDTVAPSFSANLLQISGGSVTSKANTGAAGPPISFGNGNVIWGHRVY